MYDMEEPFHLVACHIENDEMARVSCNMASIRKLNI